MQIWTFSKHHTFKYDFWEKTQYSNMKFWCFLVTPESFSWREIKPRKGETRHLKQNWPEPDDLVHLRQLLLRLISHCWVYRALQQFRQRLNVHSEIQKPLLP